MKKILLTSIAISLAFSLSACSKKIEPNNYYCFGFNTGQTDIAKASKDKLYTAIQNGNTKPATENEFRKQCETQKLGIYNEEFIDLSEKKLLSCASEASFKECYAPYQKRLTEIIAQWEKEAEISK